MSELREGDRVVAAWAESCSGPGWANTPVWVLVRRRDGTTVEECIQPKDQTEAMRTLHHIAAHVARVLAGEASKVLSRPAKKRRSP